MVYQISQLSTAKKPKQLKQVKAAIRTRQYSYRTEQSYISGKALYHLPESAFANRGETK